MSIFFFCNLWFDRKQSKAVAGLQIFYKFKQFISSHRILEVSEFRFVTEIHKANKHFRSYEINSTTNKMAEANQEQQVKILKRLLEGWRMALLPLKSVLLWEHQWHPCAIFASVSILFMTIWLMDLNTLASLAVVGLVLNFVDFIVPIICNTVYGPTGWTGQKEKMYEDICRSIVMNYNKILDQVKSFYSMRENSPSMYYIISISMLCILAWMASTINNVFLLYIFSTVVLLWPGIQQRGIFNTLTSLIYKVPKITQKTE
ncbi:ADP-ribosylation factor-like protein 6-interacting protein 1 [Pararge aegeria]|uniref:ADP-ribosylation factor-like protein 6-interacting protein 1 n=1 Tax=Pararge aegeria TaxID=116150 RepID=UPI0019D1ED80|nr:ADP-ribosylation factor-like protein 6-interacting protein 1 [Pararge aegeria]